MVVCNPFPMPTSKGLGILSTPCKSMHLCINLSSPEKMKCECSEGSSSTHPPTCCASVIAAFLSMTCKLPWKP